LIGATTLVIYAIRCSEPSLASVLGCGRTSSTNATGASNIVSLHMGKSFVHFVFQPPLRSQNNAALTVYVFFVFFVATPNHHRCCHHRCCQDSQWVQEGFSRTSGQPLPQAWSPDTGTFNEKGRTESTALHAALNATSAATFVACVADHVSAAASSSSSALLSHNYIRDVVGACHKYG